jgi:hypothetical protein
MAKRPKHTKQTQERSFADVAKGKTSSAFAKTTCTLKPPPAYPTKRIPATKRKHSFFLDLKSTDATDAEVITVIEQMTKIKGMKYRHDLSVVEIIFSSDTDRNGNIRKYDIPNKQPLFPIAPRHEAPKVVYVQMANLPYLLDEEIRPVVEKYWSSYGKVLGTEPHKIQGKWNTDRWDLLLEIERDSILEAPVAFTILDEQVVAAWPASPPSCLICHSAGHQAKKCQQKNLKVGNRSDPEKVSAKPPKGTPTQKQPSEVTQGVTASTSGTSGHQSAEIHRSSAALQIGDEMDEDRQPPTITSATPASEVAQQTISTGIFNVETLQSTETTEAYTVDSNTQIGAGSSSSGRPITPPSSLNRPASPDTPRSQAGKRQAVGPPAKVTLNDLVYATIKVHKLCLKCGEKDHGKGISCPTPLTALAVHTKIVKKFALGSFHGESNKQRKVMKEANKIAEARTDFAIPIATVVCANCEEEGHMAFECTNPAVPKGPPCKHCSKKGHVAFYCPDRVKYPFELVDHQLLSEEDLDKLNQLMRELM